MKNSLSSPHGDQADKKRKPTSGIRRKLLYSHFMLGMIGVLLLLVSLASITWLSFNSTRLATLRAPTVRDSLVVLSGVQHSLAAQRGWIVLGDPTFKDDRAAAWTNEIRPARTRLDALSTRFDNPEDQKRLVELHQVLEELYDWQWWIEDVAQTPGNEPARVLYSRKIRPSADLLREGVTALLEFETKMSNHRDRSSLQKAMADFRYWFTVSQTSLLDFIDNGEASEEVLFNFNLRFATNSFQMLRTQRGLLTAQQQEVLDWMNDQFANFQPLAEQAITIRKSPDWNHAQYWLATEAVPRARKAIKELTVMSDGQDRLMRADTEYAARISSATIIVAILLVVFMTLAANFVSHRGADRITQSISVLSQATQDFSKGRLTKDIPITSHDELGQLTEAFNLMRTSGQQSDEKLKHSALQLQEREAKMRAVLETATDSIITISETGLIESFNPAAEQMFGYAADEVLGKNINILMPTPYHNEHDGYLQHYLQTGEKRVIGTGREVVGLRKNGSTFPMDLAVSEVAQGDQRAFTGIVRDISDRKSHEQTLARQAADAEILRRISDLATEAHSTESVLQQSLDLICANMEWEVGHVFQLANDPVDELLPTTIWHLNDPTKYHAFYEKSMQLTFSSGVGLPGRVLALGQPTWIIDVHQDDNYYRAVISKASGLTGAFGLPIVVSGRATAVLEFFSQQKMEPSENLIALMHNIGGQLSRVFERKQAEQELRISEARSRAVLDTAADSIITISEAGLIESFNPTAEQMFGYSAEEILGRNVNVLMPAPYGGEHDGYLRQYLQTGEKKVIGIGREVVGLRQDGSTFPMELSVSEVAQGDRRTFTGIVRDISERKLAEQKIRDSEARSRAVLDTAADSIITISEAGLIESFNPTAEQMFGYSAEEILGRNVNVLMPAPYGGEHDGYLRQYLQTGEKKVIGIGREVVGLRKNGSTFPMELSVSEVAQGDRRTFTGIVRDISERKLAEQKIRDSEARSRAVLDTAADSIITISEAGLVESFNPTAEQMFGYSAEEILGKNVNILMPAPYGGEHDGYLRQYLQTGEKKVIGIGREVVGLRQDGSTFPMELSVSEVAQGDRRTFTGIVRDISERKLAEQKIRDSEARSRAVLDTAADSIITISEAGLVESFNPTAEQMFGYSAEEVLGRNVNVLMPAPYGGEHDGYLRQYLQTGEKKVIGIGREVVGLRKNGSTFPMELSVSEVAQGDRRTFTGIVRDISERKRFEDELKQHALEQEFSRIHIEEQAGILREQSEELESRNTELDRSNQELEDFAHIASHDLKEPLRGIHNYATFLLEDYEDKLDEEGKSKLGTLTVLAQRMETLISTLLYYSRVGRTDLAVVSTDLSHTVKEVLETVQIRLQEQGVEVRLPDEPLPEIVCDSARIGEVFRNLITNAMKYNDKPEKLIEIGFERPPEGDGGEFSNKKDLFQAAVPGEWLFWVRDNGIGIREKHMDSVFRIFKRLHGRDKFGGGTGAGLTIVKKIVERHGGRIWVESTFGEGTTFNFTLPHKTEVATDTPQDETPQDETPQLQGATIN